MINDRNSEIDEGFDDNNSDQKSECDGSKPPTPPPEGATMIPGSFIWENNTTYGFSFNKYCWKKNFH